MKKVIVFLIVFVGTACNDGFKNQTNALSEVLIDFNITIPTDEHIYILKSNFNCKGCVQRIFIQIENIVSKEKLSGITIIASDKKYLSQLFLSQINFIEDVDNSVGAYFPNSVNLTLIRTKEGKITRFKVLESTDPEIYKVDVNSFFKKL